MIPDPRRPRVRPRDERGQAVSSFVAVVLVALFGVTGLVVDGGARSAARTEAESVAAQAARAAVDAGARSRAAGRTLHTAAVRAAGQEVLAVRGIVGSVVIEGGAVHVETSRTVPTVFLSLVGIRSLSASGDATAVLED